MVLFEENGSDYPKLRQLMLVEEFKRCKNSDVKSSLDEKEVETLEKSCSFSTKLYFDS